MLFITPYLGIIVLIVSIGGIFYPKLGYFMLLVFAVIFATAPFYGRWFCGNLCPRGSFNDFWLRYFTRDRKGPKFFTSLWFRIPIVALLMGLMLWRIIAANGIADRIGMVLVTMCIATTSLAIFLGIYFHPRSWCFFCPMGTLQRIIGGHKRSIRFIPDKCVNCNLCNKICPMHQRVNCHGSKADCVRCYRCVKSCPKKALTS